MSRTGYRCESLTSATVFNQSFAWLCQRRKHYPADADVWNFRRDWAVESGRIRAQIESGEYRFSAMTRLERADGETVHLWSSRDAFVLKCLAIALERRLPPSPRCFHLKSPAGSHDNRLKSHGAKAAIREVAAEAPHHRFVLKTDLHSYYASIDPGLLLDRLATYTEDPLVLRLVGRYLDRSIEHGGVYRQASGLARGCPLSPVLGGFFLYELDCQFESRDLFYIRYMDDILVLAKTRWKLRGAVRMINQGLHELRLEKSRLKTFIGKVAKGFDFLGYRFESGRLTLARKTVENFVSRAARLYERESTPGPGPAGRLEEPRKAIRVYAAQWLRWARSGLGADPPSAVPTVSQLVEVCAFAAQIGRRPPARLAHRPVR